jgi:hypothetical protein
MVLTMGDGPGRSRWAKWNSPEPTVKVVTGGYDGTGIEAPACGAKEGIPKSERIGYLYRPGVRPCIGAHGKLPSLAEGIALTSSLADFNKDLLSYLIRVAGLHSECRKQASSLALIRTMSDKSARYYTMAPLSTSQLLTFVPISELYLL